MLPSACCGLVLADSAEHRMKKLVAAGFSSWCWCELVAFAAARPQMLVLVSRRHASALVLLALRLLSGPRVRAESGDARADDPAESLRRWLSRTETLISRSETTRRDWDRHLRPMLARQFEMATGQRQAKDHAAFHATGTMLFGAELWAWVDPAERIPHRRQRTRARPGGARRNSATVGAGMTAIWGCPRDDDRALRGGARRDRAGGGRQARGAHADPHHRARGRPRAHRGPARPWQDADRALLRRGAWAWTSRGCSSRRTCCPPTCSARRSTTCSRAASSSAADRSSPTCFSPTRSTGRRPRPRPRCWRRWPRAR